MRKPKPKRPIRDPACRRVVLEDDYDAYSIRQFCARHNLSEELFYKLQRLGTGPRTLNVGRRKLITREAAREWREALAAKQQAAE